MTSLDHTLTMTNSSKQVVPVSDEPTSFVPSPVPIPRRQVRFRAAPQPGTPILHTPPTSPVSTGIGPLIAHVDGYNALEVPRSGLNTNFASCLNLTLRIYLTNQKLSDNDKFLKDVSMYHPDAFDLYCSFIFVYHILRVRSEVGYLSSSESTLLSEMMTIYPPSTPRPRNTRGPFTIHNYNQESISMARRNHHLTTRG